MSNFPEDFKKAIYVEWHNQNIEPNKQLCDEIDSLLNKLKHDQKTRLNNLAQLLSAIDTFIRLSNLSKKKDISDIKTEILLENAIHPENYNNLFKSQDSIIEKLWRKNKGRLPENYITSENIQSHIGDLIRTSIVTSTFEYASEFASTILIWRDLVENFKNIDESLYTDIEKIESKEEVKMQNGYFAYHLDVHYTDGIRIEIQIYSRLSQIWRHLSHKLYEKVRIGEDVTWGHGTMASRLVSLGHLLHLAECEVEYLKAHI
ncbi:hypothetical protein [Acinetobacter piscicola]|uniref:hypothetical protein n=1 Tax=Acinetobacter piscicola TaxID=2006115 RepID=UPI000B7E420A|nr:hypothetical protein [Acinetobacter piscicola]